MRACGTTRSRGNPATGSTATRNWRSSPRSRPAGGVPTWLGAHAVPPEFDSADAYWTSPWPRCSPRWRRAPRRRTSSWREGAFDVGRHAATSRPAVSTGSRCACTPTSSPRRAGSSWRSSSAPAAWTTSRRPGRGGRVPWRRATSPPSCFRLPRSPWAVRCRPAGRSSMRAPRSRSRPTSTPGAPTRRACRSPATSRARRSGSRPPRPSPPAR